MATKKTAPGQRRGSGNHGNGNPDKIKDQGFDKYPERINRKGRPTLLRDITDSLQAKGYEKATVSQVMDVYMSLLNLDEAAIKELMANKKTPFMTRRLIHLMSTDKFLDVLDRVMDRAFGRTKQFIEITEADAPEPDTTKEDEAELLKKVDERLAKIDRVDLTEEDHPTNESNESLLGES